MIKILRKFDQIPNQDRKLRFETLPKYKQGKFQNIEKTPPLAEGQSMWQIMREFLKSIPSYRT